MKLQVMSDLHLEFHRDNGMEFLRSLDPSGVDVLILAGDITSLRNYDWAQDQFADFCARYKHVIYCQGNHDYYGTDIGTADHHLGGIESQFKNLHVLRHGMPIVIDGQRFIGGTLWFKHQDSNRHYKSLMNDFYVIKGGFEDWVRDQNELTVRNLNTGLCTGDVVVTHHLPSFKSVHEKYRMSSTNRFFVCDMEDLILARVPSIWVHGHTHEQVDYMIGTTRIVANPLGYPKEDLTAPFNPKLVIDI